MRLTPLSSQLSILVRDFGCPVVDGTAPVRLATGLGFPGSLILHVPCGGASGCGGSRRQRTGPLLGSSPLTKPWVERWGGFFPHNGYVLAI